MMKLFSVLNLSSPWTASPLTSGIDDLAKRRGKVIFIDAVNEVTRERSMSYLKPEHQQRIADAYHAFQDVEGFAKVASLADIRANDGNLSIPLYVRGKAVSDEKGEYVGNGLREVVSMWQKSSLALKSTINSMLENLENSDG